MKQNTFFYPVDTNKRLYEFYAQLYVHIYIHRIRYANRNTFYKVSKITKEKKKKHFNKRNLVNPHQLELKKKMKKN